MKSDDQLTKLRKAIRTRPANQRHCECGTALPASNRSGKCPSCVWEAQYPAPTLAEIAAGCAEIRDGWNAEEEMRHRAVKPVPVEIRPQRRISGRGMHDD